MEEWPVDNTDSRGDFCDSCQGLAGALPQCNGGRGAPRDSKIGERVHGAFLRSTGPWCVIMRFFAVKMGPLSSNYSESS